MARHAQIRSIRLLVAILASTSMLLVAPSVAWAGSARAHPVLYLRHGCTEASPKAISGRTSYHEV